MLAPAVGLADRSQGRSVVMTRGGIVATEHPIASQIGVQVLNDGGNAIDAAVAANAAMGVVAPMANGIGGDLFAIVYHAKSGQIFGLNASGWAPKGLTREFLISQGFQQMPTAGVHTVTVPGAVDGWDKLLKRFGRKSLKEVLAPSIRVAEQGFPVTEWFSSYWVASEKLLRRSSNASATYLLNGVAPKPGQVFSNPDLAWTYRQIAKSGRDAFYRGSVAKRILASTAELGGTLSKEDLSEFSSEWVTPISTTYRGWEVYEIPPNGQGIAALQMLNIMEQFELPKMKFPSADAFHVMIEAKKLAYADMQRYVCDQKFHQVPVVEMLSKDYAKQLATQIDLHHASSNAIPGKLREGGDTTYLCVVDAEGNMVSYIQSNYESFGSGIVPTGAGFALQNRGALFTLDPAHPNVVAGRKRPLHTIIPGFMTKGDVRMAFGIMGGWNQAQAHAQFVSHVVDHEMNIQAALEAPRFTKLTFPGVDLQIEDRVPGEIRAEMEQKGHAITVRGPFATSVGGGQVVMRNSATGVNYGASDPRKDGAATPQAR